MKENFYITPSAIEDWAPFLDEACVARPDDLVENLCLERFVSMLERVGQNGRRSKRAWRIGRQSDYRTRGKVGRAVLGSGTLGSSLRRLCQYSPLIQEGTEVKLTSDNSTATLSYKILDPSIWPRTQDALYTVGVYSSLIRGAAPEAWRQVEVFVEGTHQQVNCDLAEVVGTTVSYENNANGLSFPARLLDAKINFAPPVPNDVVADLSRLIAQQRRKQPMSTRIRQLIFRDLGEKEISQDQVAKEIGVSSRTLRRRLSRAGIGFQDLLDECRMQTAMHEFRCKRIVSLSELALRLGYSEHSTFSRAFSRWAGTTPQEFRHSIVS